MATPAQLAGVFKRLSSIDIIPHQYRCVRVRNRHAMCRKCADACTSGCISFEGGQIAVNREKCTGCGTCSTVCPTCALEAARPNDAVLLARARRALRAAGGLVTFVSTNVLRAVAGAVDEDKIAEVTNLGRVEETLIVQLALAGARRIVLVCAPAADKAERMGARAAKLVCDSANSILAAWGGEVRAVLTDTLPDEVLLCGGYKDGRSFGSRVSHAAQPPTPTDTRVDAPCDDTKAVFHRIKVMKDGTLPHFTPDRREALLDALFEMGEPCGETVPTRIWGHAVIDPELCTGCRMCAAFCPTGALFKYRDADGSTGVEHSPGDCVKCLCCVDVCRHGAIHVEDDVHPADVLSGAVERYEMPPEELFRSDPRSIVNAVKKSFKTERIYER